MGGGPVRLLARLRGLMGEGEERNAGGKRGETEREQEWGNMSAMGECAEECAIRLSN